MFFKRFLFQIQLYFLSGVSSKGKSPEMRLVVTHAYVLHTTRYHQIDKNQNLF